MTSLSLPFGLLLLLSATSLAAESRWTAQPVARLDDARAERAIPCAEDPHLILLASEDRRWGALLTGPALTTPPGIDGAPAGWIGRTVVWRRVDGSYALLDPATLTTGGRVGIDALPGPDARFQATLSWLPEATAIPVTVTAEEAPALVALERPAPGIAGGAPGRTVKDAEGRTVLTEDRDLYQVEESPDRASLLMYSGDDRWDIHHLLSARQHRLPAGMERWRWIDARLLLGVKVTWRQPPSGDLQAERSTLSVYDLSDHGLAPVAGDWPGEVDPLAIGRGGRLVLRQTAPDGTRHLHVLQLVPAAEVR